MTEKDNLPFCDNIGMMHWCISQRWHCEKQIFSSNFTSVYLHSNLHYLFEISVLILNSGADPGGTWGHFVNQKKHAVYHLSTARIFINATSRCQMPGNHI
jgi:hypothetical protein